MSLPLIAVVLASVGVVIAAGKFSYDVLRDRRARAERDRRERERLAQFEGQGMTVDNDGECIHLVWGGPLNLIADERPPRVMSQQFQERLFEAIARDGNRHPLMSGPGELRGPQVYETDAGRTWKRKLQGTGLFAVYYLFVTP